LGIGEGLMMKHPLVVLLFGNSLKLRFLSRRLIGAGSILMLAACSSKPTPPPVDMVGTIAAQMASDMLTQTVAAYSPTPFPATSTPIPTETMTLEPTKDASIKIITVVVHAPCWFGPGEKYGLESYINVPKKVLLLGIGSVPGWYIIKNPYFNAPCWVEAANVQVNSAMDLTQFPVMSP
jgi:hypothetical protein